jgi:hypothetical protein
LVSTNIYIQESIRSPEVGQAKSMEERKLPKYTPHAAFEYEIQIKSERPLKQYLYSKVHIPKFW